MGERGEVRKSAAEDLKKRAGTLADQLKEDIIGISLNIHKNPELAFHEYKAKDLLTEFLRKEGFSVKEKVGGLDTSFLASFSNKNTTPNIAFLAEYDALPVLGHACGHNIIAASAVGAASVLKRLMDESGLLGTVSCFGTPAEEGGGGKVIMLNAGAFRNIDAALMVHPTSGISKIGGRSLATTSFKISYYGKPSHAAGNPQEGINALDAANLFFHAVACLRQHVPEDVRMHGIITKGGDAVNIIPERTEIHYLIRSYSQKTLEELSQRIRECAQAGAIATRCKVEIEEKEGYKARIPNMVLAGLFRQNLRLLGEDVLEGVVDGKGSTDFGDVSRAKPSCNAYISIAPKNVAGHSHEFREAASSEKGCGALMISVKAMAFTAIDLMRTPELLKKAQEEFNLAKEC